MCDVNFSKSQYSVNFFFGKFERFHEDFNTHAFKAAEALKSAALDTFYQGRSRAENLTKIAPKLKPCSPQSSNKASILINSAHVIHGIFPAYRAIQNPK